MEFAAKRMNRFYRVMRRIGQFQAALILGILYILFWMPVGLLTRLLADWLMFKAPKETAWHPRQKRLNLPQHLKDPF